jgi:hypothetical protein
MEGRETMGLAVRRRLLTAVAALAACGAAATAAAQGVAPPPGRWAFGLRLGVFDMTNAPDSYDAVYGDPMPQAGVQLERDWRRWRLALSADYGQVDGERALPTDPPLPTGIEETLTLTPVHLTAAYRFRPQARWDVYAGLGPSLLSWKDETDFASESGSEVGGSALVGLRRQARGRGWEWGGELRWSSFPGALPDAGFAGLFGEDDPGGLALTLVAARGF